MKNLEKMKKSMKGITLIALVVTIIVLLILAAIAVNLTIGENGIIARADGTRILQSHADIKDSTIMIEDEYVIEKQVEDKGNDLIGYAIITGYCDENGKIDVEKMTGHDTGYGKGTDNKDVYLLEKEETKYIVNYYDKEGNKTTIIELAGDVLSNEELFEVNVPWIDDCPIGHLIKDAIFVKGEYYKEISSAYGKIVSKDGNEITDITIPSIINGKVITDIQISVFIDSNTTMGIIDVSALRIPATASTITNLGPFEKIEELYIPKSVISIEMDAIKSGKVQNILYEGTIEEWNKIQINGTSIKYPNSIICTDGVINKSNN